MKYLFLIFFYFITLNLVLAQSKDNNYEQLKEIEKKLLNNQEVYLEILKVEKEVNKKKYSFHIRHHQDVNDDMSLSDNHHDEDLYFNLRYTGVLSIITGFIIIESTTFKYTIPRE